MSRKMRETHYILFYSCEYRKLKKEKTIQKTYAPCVQVISGNEKSRTPPFMSAISMINATTPKARPKRKNLNSIIPNCPFFVNTIDLR